MHTTRNFPFTCRIPIKSLLVVGLWSILTQGQAQQLSTTIDSQVKLALQASAMAWNRGDLPAYMQAYHRSDSLLFIGSRGPTYGWETTLENYRRSYAGEGKMGVLTFQLIKTEVISEEAVFMSGKWSLRRESDMPEGYFTLLWKNIEGEWKIVYDHSSTATP